MLKLLVGTIILCLLIVQTAGSPQRPFPQHQGYAPSTIRPNHRSQAQQDDDVRAFYNAGRDPWRIGVDALLSGDSVSLTQVRKISVWAQSAAIGDPQQIKPGYTLDGQPIPPGNYFTSFFAAPLGVAAMTEPTQQAWLNAVYDDVYARHEDYYEDSVTLLCLLVMSGNYWDPTAPALDL